MNESGQEIRFSERQPYTVDYMTRASERHPDTNEDALLLLPEKNVYGIFDGVSTSESAQVGANIAAQKVREYLQQAQTTAASSPEEVLLQSLLEANKTVQDKNTHTTALLMQVIDGKCSYASVGDSRLYLIRGNTLVHLTLDAQEHVITRKLQGTAGRSQLMSEQVAAAKSSSKAANRHVTFSLGMKDSTVRLTADIGSVTLEGGDILLAMSDGITDPVTDTKLLTAIGQAQSGNIPDQLIAVATQENLRSDNLRKKQDDKTVLSIRYQNQSPSQRYTTSRPVQRYDAIPPVVKGNQDDEK